MLLLFWLEGAERADGFWGGCAAWEIGWPVGGKEIGLGLIGFEELGARGALYSGLDVVFATELDVVGAGEEG
jgi:hypothetical protein